MIVESWQMAVPTRRVRKVLFPEEQTWVRSFVGFHGGDGVIGFVEEELGSVALVHVIESLHRGTVTWAEKCNGPGTKCVVEYISDDGPGLRIVVHLVSSEEYLQIMDVKDLKEPGSGTPNAA
jgi:hypothetical protein